MCLNNEKHHIQKQNSITGNAHLSLTMSEIIQMKAAKITPLTVQQYSEYLMILIERVDYAGMLTG